MEKMSVEQLKAVKEQIDQEVVFLQDSLNNVRSASTRLEIASNALHDHYYRMTHIPRSIRTFIPRNVPLEECMYKIPVDASGGDLIGRNNNGQRRKRCLIGEEFRTLDSADKVVVNIGTGYFIEKTMDEGKEYCEHKMNLMKSNYDQLIEVASKKKNIGDEVSLLAEQSELTANNIVRSGFEKGFSNFQVNVC
ncbi:hypothetical protein IFM89_010071 [Coptis chinensis]|uniref:Prefoldin subunit 5 n=1 Tax=Coptis chinensis TaxID=261450 RepID=A0A835HJS1_9MAGN|nr:hypothetical protein IFM89_010071 [Coptis chinensis]